MDGLDRDVLLVPTTVVNDQAHPPLDVGHGSRLDRGPTDGAPVILDGGHGGVDPNQLGGVTCVPCLDPGSLHGSIVGVIEVIQVLIVGGVQGSHRGLRGGSHPDLVISAVL